MPLRSQPACFFEADPARKLLHRAAVEGIGTLLLMLAATGSGLQAHRLFPSEPGLGLLVSALAIPGALVGLIMALGAVSGGHFNPLITALQWLGRERSLHCTVAYIGAQMLGAIGGALLAAVIFGAPVGGAAGAVNWSMGLSELVASAGLMLVVCGCARSRRTEAGPFAVGAWLTGAILAMPSTSYANPAIALGAAFAAGPIALNSATAWFFVASEVLGALAAFAIVGYAYPAEESAAVFLERKGG
jgi:glycerol uptake facilitator-like aquaporin